MESHDNYTYPDSDYQDVHRHLVQLVAHLEQELSQLATDQATLKKASAHLNAQDIKRAMDNLQTAKASLVKLCNNMLDTRL